MDEKVEFRVPFAGTMTQLNVNEKQVVFQQQTVLRLEDFTSNILRSRWSSRGFAG